MKHVLDPGSFRQPAVRHLAWMFSAAPLWQCSLSVRLPRLETVAAQLALWDETPGAGPPVLTEVPHPRLGAYFEQLYECLLTDVLGWELIARNLQIRTATRTLGELDFVVRNPASGAIEHHEIAVKFYLGFPQDGGGIPLWYGPNASDRLDIKARRLVAHQSHLTEWPETRTVLRRLGIGELPVPRLIMLGYLFHPPDSILKPPPEVPGNHERGQWLYLNQIESVNTEHWVHLPKPHWLGPWIQADSPSVSESRATLDKIASTGKPRLFARLERDCRTGLWTERQRFFVVPDHWPQQ